MDKNGIDDNALLGAVEEMESGLVDAALGGTIYKKRLPLSGRGKRGSARTIVATRQEDLWFFLYGFNKNERSAPSRKELSALQAMGKDLLSLSEEKLALALRKGIIKEVTP